MVGVDLGITESSVKVGEHDDFDRTGKGLVQILPGGLGLEQGMVDDVDAKRTGLIHSEGGRVHLAKRPFSVGEDRLQADIELDRLVRYPDRLPWA